MQKREKDDKDKKRIDFNEHWYGSARLRILACFVSYGIYASIICVLGDRLGISNNYFVILPIIIAALAWGAVGGIISGILALPSNLALFALTGHLGFSPASLLIAEISGTVIGTTLGVLGDRFRLLGEEILRRKEIEKELRSALEERNVLIREIQHRVKNNLGVIKSMLYLMMIRTEEVNCREAFRDMTERLMSMALVQDQLSTEKSLKETVNTKEYLIQLVRNITHSRAEISAEVLMDIPEDIPPLHMDRITPLGILINEVITNAYKHAFPGINNPTLSISATLFEGELVIIIADNGPGYDGAIDKKHLGRTLIDALASQIHGFVFFDRDSGTRVIIRFPVEIH